MIPLASNPLSQKATKRLTEQQAKVNNKPSFAEKAAEAKRLWNNKSSSQVGEKAFYDIKNTLETMCVSVEVCNYCEQNEANDIEHIYPKSFFPEHAFVWDNYLLACKQCNSGHKLDKCHVLDDQNNIFEVVRGIEPPFKTVSFINPRIEDPNQFMLINLYTFKYILIPNLSKQNKNKAEKTLEILELNARDTLIAARRSAAKYYYDRVERLVKIINAPSVEALKNVLTPYEDEINETQPLENIKERLKEGFKKDIKTHQHPSVWYSIKMIASKTDERWKRLFDQFPEALEW